MMNANVTGLVHRDGRDVEAPRCQQLEGPFDVFAEKVRHEKDDRLVREHLDQIVGRTRDVGTRSFRLEDEQVADQADSLRLEVSSYKASLAAERN